jgi:sarcosine oxidase subunit beta
MERAEIAIVGAGVTGLSIAWHVLERALMGVALYEKAGVGAGASGVQPGGVRQQWSTAVNCVLARDSLAFYREVGERLHARVDLRFDECGYVFLAHSQQELERLAAAVGVQHGVGIRSRLLSPDEAAEIVPGLNVEGLAGASFCAEDGYFAQPQGVVEAFAEAVVRGGAEIRLGQVSGLEEGPSGWTLRLADGDVARAERVVVAAGYDTPLLLTTTGVSVPIEREERYLFYSDPIRERLLEPLVVSSERQFAAKQLANGRVLASHLRATGDPTTDGASWRRHVRSCILELLPRLEYVSLPLLVEGLYDVTPDNQAIVGEVPGRPGLWVAAGFSGHGFMIAPEVGRAVAAQLCGEDPGPAFAELAVDRFARGALAPETSIV